MNVVVDAPTRAFVPWTSKCWGQRGSHHGFVVCWLLKTERVWAEVPRADMLRAAMRLVMRAWAVWRGAGLIFMVGIVVVVDFRLIFFFYFWLREGYI